MRTNMNLQFDSPTDDIADYLLAHHLLDEKPTDATTEKPGEGNMNLLLRFAWPSGSYILKQAKPYVNKYPDIPAPVERIATEATYYDYANRSEALQSRSPKIHLYDAGNHLIVMEDLGQSKDFLHLYQNDQKPSEELIVQLLAYLNDLHHLPLDEETRKAFPENRKLRELNHQHIFVLPFQADNGFPLNDFLPGLQHYAEAYMQDIALTQKIKALGDIYLSPGQILLHGDFYPGSWMQTENGLRIIDPEFGFMGRAEFDIGIFLAHLVLCGQDLQEAFAIIDKHYKRPANFHPALVRHFAGAEILRRLLGIAQLPLDSFIDQRAHLMRLARQLVLS
ncbi:MAG: phosphotransferase [Bacteroidota bacterium]